MYKRRILILGMFIFISIVLSQLNVNANNEDQTLLNKVNSIVQQINIVTKETIQENPDEIVVIKVNDSVLYETLLGSYGAQSTENDLEITMTKGQIDELTEFEYIGSDLKKIKDITGIENFTQLETLKLNKNAITDITKIGELTKLTNLEIKSNGLKNLTDLSKLTNLKKLDISDNSISSLEGITTNYSLTNLYAASNQIVNIAPITTLVTINELDLSNNNISDISTISSLTNLRILDLSFNTSIREIIAITSLENLNKLSLANNNLISDLTKLVDKKTENNKIPKLINLQELNLENVNNASTISIANLKGFTNLTILNLNNNGLKNMSGILELKSLEKLYLDNNSIEDISPLIKTTSKTVDGKKVTVVEEVSGIKELRMRSNEIEEIDILSNLADTITYLDLRKNHIHNISSIEALVNLEAKNLYLQEQTANFNIKRKSNTSVKQKIILENIVQKCKSPNSKIYDEKADFTVTGEATLNTDTYTLPEGQTGVYSEIPGYYNIVFLEDVKKGDIATVKINEGRASRK